MATLIVQGRAASPPSSAPFGGVYIVAPSASGAWSGQQERLAVWQGFWRFEIAEAGTVAIVQGDAARFLFDGDEWADILDEPVTVFAPRDTLAAIATTGSASDLVSGAVPADRIGLLPVRTVATAGDAAAAGAGARIYVSDGDGGDPCIAVSDGTDWRRIPLGAAISTT